MNKEKIKQFFKKNSPFIILCVFYYLIEIIFYVKFGDELTISNRKSFANQSIIDEVKFAISEFNNWGGRIFVDSVIRILLHYLWIWKILNAILYALIAKAIVYLIDAKEDRMKWAVVALMFLYPQSYNMTAGWAVTSMTYLWSVSIGVLFFAMLKHYIQKDYHGVRRFVELLVMTIILVYATDIEQGAFFIAIILAAMCIIDRNLIKEKIWFLLVSIGMLCVHLLSPGNQNRGVLEMHWFPDYNQVSLLQKIEIGLSSTIFRFVYKYNTTFLILAVLMTIIIYTHYKEKEIRFVGACLLLTEAVFGVFMPMVSSEYTNLGEIADHMTDHGMINFDKAFRFAEYVPFAYMLFISCLIMVGCYLCIKDKRIAVYAIVGLIASVGASVAIAISPTIWASRDRTLTLFYFMLISLCALYVKEIYEEKNERKIKIVNGLLYFCVFCGMFEFVMQLNI